MKFSRKLIIFAAIFMVSWIFIMAFIIENVVMQGYYDLEEANIEKQMKKIIFGLDSEREKYKTLAIDWANWDDLYAFVENGNKEFIDSNLVYTFHKETKVNYVVISDKDGNVIYSSGYDLEKEEEKKVPEKLLTEVQRYVNQDGIVNLKTEPVEIIVREIRDSKKTKEPNGTIVFAYERSKQNMEEFGERFDVEIQIKNRYSDFSKDGMFTKMKKQKDKIVVEYFVPYIDEPYAINFEMVFDRSISELGRRTSEEAFIMFIVAFMAWGTFVYFTYKRTVKRIKKIIQDVSNITKKEDMKKRVILEGNDELSILKNNINDMLDRIETMNCKLNEYATFDTMTGVLNRRSGYERLEILMKQSIEEKFPLTICFVDINDLKIVNDLHGHNMGDQLIIDVTNLIVDSIRKTDVTCRLGGDEFLIIFPNSTKKQVEHTMERIIDLMEEKSKTLPYNLSISKGIEMYDKKADIDEFVETADKKMYLDKEKVKGRLGR